jgi:hypothetical protein
MITIFSQETRMDAHFESLAAWVDGEPVSRADVARALETSEGRDYVLDLMALRHLVAVTTPTLAATTPPRRVPRWPAVAAAAALMCVVGGYVAGRVVTPSVPTTANTAAPVSAPASMTAPAPTRVIQLGEGTDWRETGGGR